MLLSSVCTSSCILLLNTLLQNAGRYARNQQIGSQHFQKERKAEVLPGEEGKLFARECFSSNVYGIQLSNQPPMGPCLRLAEHHASGQKQTKIKERAYCSQSSEKSTAEKDISCWI